MITTKTAENLFIKMQEHIECEFTSVELDALTAIMTSDVALKAFGRSLAYCRLAQQEMCALDMSIPANITKFSKGQGQIEGVNEIISGMLRLIIEDEEEEENKNE